MEERVFKRKLYEKMLQWKRERNGATALLIKGARRVGKSTIAEEFAKREYDSYILIDSPNVSRKLRICLMIFDLKGCSSVCSFYMMCS